MRLEQQVTERLAQAQESSLRQAASLREQHRCWALLGAPLPGQGQCWASPCPSQAHFLLPLSPTSVFWKRFFSQPLSHTPSPQGLPPGTLSSDACSVPPS